VRRRYDLHVAVVHAEAFEVVERVRQAGGGQKPRSAGSLRLNRLNVAGSVVPSLR
jgi:hypothetical protein